MTSLKSSALIVYPVHVVLLIFSKECEERMLQSGHSLMSFLPVETEYSEGMRVPSTGGLENQYNVIPLPSYWML